MQFAAKLHTDLATVTRDYAKRVEQLSAVTRDSADASLIDARAKEAIKAQTDLLQAKTKLAADEYLKLNPQISQSGVASAYAAGQISKSVAEYISMTLKIQSARNELAQLQAQAGMSPAVKAAVAANPGDVGRYISGGSQTADPKVGEAAVARLKELRAQEIALAQAKRNAIITNGSAAERQRLLNKELADATRIYGQNSVQAVNAKTALDSFNQSLQKTTATTAGSAGKQFNTDLKLAVAEQDTAIDKMQSRHDLLVKHLSALKQGSAEYKNTLAEILELEDKIASAKEKQRDAVTSMKLAQLDNDKAWRAEERQLAQARRILNSTEFSPDQKAEAADKIARIPLEREQRERNLARQQRAAGVAVQNGSPTAPTSTTDLLRPSGPGAGVGAVPGRAGAAPTVDVALPANADGGVTIHVYIGDEEIMPRLVRVLRNSQRNVAPVGSRRSS